MQAFWDALLSLVPPLAVGGVFWVIMRSILRADATERRVYGQIEAEERAKLEAAKAAKAAKAAEPKDG